MEANRMRDEFLLRYGNNFGSNKSFDDREITSFLNKAQHEFVTTRLAPWKNRPQLGVGSHPVRNSELAGLLTATHAIPRKYHILGTADNGALPGPDLDQAIEDTDKYGVFVAIPDEVLYVMSEGCKTVRGNITKYNTPVKRKTIMEYRDEIYNNYNNPGDNLVWSLDWGSYTTAEHNVGGSYTNSTKNYSDNNSGFNMSGECVITDENTGAESIGTTTINTNRSVYLIPGKSWKISEYTIHYIKEPANINVDIQTPSLQIHSQLPDSTHNEIVDLAVKFASASVVPEQSKYQVNQVESKEDE